MTTFETFEAADAARVDGQRICGTYVGDAPVYFLMAEQSTDDQIRDAAFEVKNGRPPSEYELWLLNMAQLQKVDA